MALINLQSALYFSPRIKVSYLIERLEKTIKIINETLNIDLRPLDDTYDKILKGDELLFEENGKQIFLLYNEEEVFYNTNEWLLYISFVDGYSQCNYITITPELPEPIRELTNFVWNRIITITEIMATEMKPLIAQINGLDEDEDSEPQIILPDSITRNKLPDFFTPYTYLDESLVDSEIAEELEAADIYKVERLPAGWSLQIVKDFYDSLSVGAQTTLQELLPSQEVFYRQTSVFED